MKKSYLFKFLLLILSMQLMGSVNAQTFTTVSEDFSVGSFASGIESIGLDPFTSGNAGSGAFTGETVASKSSGGSINRSYIQTVSGNYIDFNWEAVIDFIHPGSSGGDFLVFFGIGEPSSTNTDVEPNTGIFFRNHDTPFESSDQLVAREDNTNNHDVKSFGGIGTGHHRVKMLKIDNNLSFFIDKNNTGTFPETPVVIDLSASGYDFLTNSTSHIFIGGGSNEVQVNSFEVTSSTATALDFDGATSYIDLGDLGTLPAQGTFEAWVLARSIAPNHAVIQI